MADKTLIMTMGLPRSGKSTWAMEQSAPVVNPDAIRLALYGEPFLIDAEKMVWTIAMYMVKTLFETGYREVILDSTNIKRKNRDDWISDEWDRRLVRFSAPVKECISRAKKSGKEYLIPVIKRMAEVSVFLDTEEDFISIISGDDSFYGDSFNG